MASLGGAGAGSAGSADLADSADSAAQRLAGNRLSGMAPVAGPGTRLLLLGSFPGVASLAAGRYYGHPRNQFWPILSALWGIDLMVLPYAQRLDELARRGLGLWDVYGACQRKGSLDSAIQAAVPNDLAGLIATLPQLSAIAHNGGESARAMRITAGFGIPVYRLPSSSPANASWSFKRKLDAWRVVFAASGLAVLAAAESTMPG